MGRWAVCMRDRGETSTDDDGGAAGAGEVGSVVVDGDDVGLCVCGGREGEDVGGHRVLCDGREGFCWSTR